MTVEPLELQSSYTILGTGPYTIQNPYGAGEITVKVDVAGVLTDLVADTDFTVSPESSSTTGNLTLSASAAATYSGATLLIDRAGEAQQGFLGVAGSREKGLEEQLDAMTRRLQEVQRDLARAIRVTAAVNSFVAQAGKAIIFDDQGNPAAGPTAADIAAAQGYAQEAATAKAAAEAAQAAAEAAENSLLEWQSAWVTAKVYAPSDIVRVSGSSYICVSAHTSGTFSTDLAAGHWEILAQKGDPGAGTGDLLAANNLGDLDDADAALANLGGKTIGIALLKALATADARTVLQLGGAALLADSTNTDLAVDGSAAARRSIVKSYVDAAIASAGVTTAAVLAAISGASIGEVGTYAFCTHTTQGPFTVSPGATVSGSLLRYAGADGDNVVSPVPSGTWRCMGYLVNDRFGSQAEGYSYHYYPTLWLRIA